METESKSESILTYTYIFVLCTITTTKLGTDDIKLEELLSLFVQVFVQSSSRIGFDKVQRDFMT